MGAVLLQKCRLNTSVDIITIYINLPVWSWSSASLHFPSLKSVSLSFYHSFLNICTDKTPNKSIIFCTLYPLGHTKGCLIFFSKWPQLPHPFVGYFQSWAGCYWPWLFLETSYVIIWARSHPAVIPKMGSRLQRTNRCCLCTIVSLNMLKQETQHACSPI